MQFAFSRRSAFNTRMRHALFLVLLTFGSLHLLASPNETAATAARSTFEGVWVGEIAAPNTRTEIGLAFTRTQHGLLVSVNFPAMFLHGVNFGEADIRGSEFTLAPLNLTLTLAGDRLTGFFAPARLPVGLRRGGSFSAPAAEQPYPPAPSPAWTRQLDAGVWASPAEFGGNLYVAAVDGKVHALRAADGAELWTWAGSHPMYGAPAATEDSVYVVDSGGELVALARVDGTLRWRLPLQVADRTTTSEKDPTFNHRAASPVIDANGVLYVGSPDGGLHAVRAKTGRTIWRHEIGAPIYSAPAIDGNTLIVGCFDGSVVALDRRTRRELMRVKLGGAVVSTPAVTGDRVVVGARDYMLYGLDRKGVVAWRNSFWFSWVESSPRLFGGVLFVGGSDYRRVSAIEPATGRQIWSTDVRGLSWGSPVVGSNTVYAGTAGQNIAGTVLKHTGGLIALDRATGSVRWRYDSPLAPSGGFSGFAGSLSLVEQWVIGASVDGSVIAFRAVD